VRPAPIPPAVEGTGAGVLAAFGAGGGAGLVVGVRAVAAAGTTGAAPPTGADPLEGTAAPADLPAITLVVRAVLVGEKREILSAKTTVPPGRVSDASAALGLALRPLLPAAATPGGPLPPGHPTPPRSPWRVWAPALIVGGGAVVSAGIAILVIALRGPEVPGFGATVELPGR
jgi:hypothetical protein